MKKGLHLQILTIIFLTFNLNVLFAQVPSYVPSTGLVSYWPFNGNANDASGNGNNGTVNGATLTSDRFGNLNSAYSFNGVSNYISTNLNSMSNLIASSLEFTSSLWVKTTDLNGPLLSFQGTNGIEYDIHVGTLADIVQSSGDFGIFVRDNCCGTGNNIFGNNVTNNQWANIVITRSTTGVLKLYKNGTLISTSGPGQNGALQFNPMTMAFGADLSWIIGAASGGCMSCNTIDQRYLNGSLDDIGTWSRVLTAAEITGLYNSTPIPPTLSIAATPSTASCPGTPVTLTASTTSSGATYSWSPGGATTPSITVSPTSTTTYSCTVTANSLSTTSSTIVTVLLAPTITATNASICAGGSTTLTAATVAGTSNPCPTFNGSLALGLVESYSFCGNPNNMINNSNNGVVSGATLTTDALGNPNSAFSFNGTSDYISIPNDFLNGQPSSSTSFRIRFLKNSNGNFCLWNKDGSWLETAIYITNDNKLGLFWAYPNYYSGIETTSNTILNNIWYDVVIVVANNSGQIYLNNILQTNVISSITNSTIGFSSSGTCGTGINRFGFQKSSCIPTSFFNGKLDEFQIYNRQLSLLEIQQLYTQGQTTYAWSPGGATTPSITVSPTTTTTYTCTVTDANGACSSTQTITVNALPNVNAGLDQNVCASTITTLTATGASTYSWSGGIQNGIPFIPTTTTTYTVTGTNAAGCTATDQVLVTVNPLPTLAAIAGPTNVCEGATMNLTNTTTGGTWISTNTAIATVNNSGVVTGVSTGSTNITYTYTDANGCSNSTTKIIYVNPTPVASISVIGSLGICPGQSVTMCGPTGGNSYLWCNGMTTACITTTFAGTYCLIVTNSFGCSSNNAQVIVTANPLPISNAGPDVTKNCIQNTTGAVIGAAAVAGNTYAWSPTTGLSSATVANPTANPLFTTTYTVTTTNAVGCTSTDQVIVTVNTFQPTANAGLDFTKTCTSNVNGLAIGASSVTGNTYAWTPSTGLSSATVSNPTANPSTTTTYTLTATNISSGCTATDQVLVTVNNQGPTVDAGIDISKTCVSNVNGATIGMTAIAGNSYTWTPATGLSSTSIANPFANPTATTTYTVSSTNPTTGCTSTDQIIVTVNNIPPTANAGLDATVSCNTNVGGAILGTPTVAGNSYSWTPSTGLNSSTLSQPTANPSTNTTYNLMVMNASSGCMSTDQVDVSVNTTPATANAGLDGSVNCLNSGTGFSIGSTPVAGMTYAWTPSTGLSSATIANPLASPTVATVYTLTATNSASGCTANDQVTVFINTQVPSVDAGLNQIICAGTPVTLTGNGSAGATFQWDNGIQNGVAFVPTTTTTYTLTATAANGCSSTDQVIVAVNSLPSVSAGPDVQSCNGSPVTLAGTGALTYTWQPAIQNGQAFIPVNSSAFIVTGTDANNCHSTDTVYVAVGQATSSTMNESACDSYTLNGQSYTQAGTYIQVINNTSGCDSTITLNLSMEFSPITPVITLTNGVTMTVDAQANASLQWINCSDLTPIAGATGTTFTASVNGVYAVVASNVCGSDTSACSTVNSVGLGTLSSNGISIFPNPTNELLTVQVPVAFLGSEWNLVDIRGRQVLNGQVDIEQFQLNLSDLARGTYWLSLGTNQPIQVVKN